MKNTLPYHLVLLLVIWGLSVDAQQVNYSKEHLQIIQEVRDEFEAMISEMRLATSSSDREKTVELDKPVNHQNALPNEKNTTNAMKANSLVFAPPVPGEHSISSFFGYRTDPFTKKRAFHKGIDIPLPMNTPVTASLDGTVLKEGKDKYGGKFVLLKHENSYMTLYAHLSRIMVQKGEQVQKGDIIGLSGNTGRSTGPHLHYEIYSNDKPINPLSLLTL